MVIKKWFQVSLLAGVTSLAMADDGTDKQGIVYKGLQNVNGIAKLQGINPKDTNVRWELGDRNLSEWLLAPWDEGKVNRAIADFEKEYGSIAATAFMVAKNAMLNNFDASGHQITEQDVQQLKKKLERTRFLKNFHSNARAITIADADAQFVPSDIFVIKDQAPQVNIAANQKSSNTLISRNTPVFVLGQLITMDTHGFDPSEDSWAILWRPEFGIRFVKAKHVALVSDALASDFPIHPDDEHLSPSSRLKLTDTSRVKSASNDHRLPLGTPVFSLGDQYMMAERSAAGPMNIVLDDTRLRLHAAELAFVKLSVDPAGKLEDQLKSVPLPLSYHSYLSQLNNVILQYPLAYIDLKNNENRYFAFGEGTIGPDGERGMDSSTFVLKLLQPFGKWLPRYSADQVEEGVKNRLIIKTNKANMEQNYKAMIDHCKIGHFVSTGSGNNMACLGNISLHELGKLSKEAMHDAMSVGGMTTDDRVPLVALSTTGIVFAGDFFDAEHAGKLDIPSLGETFYVSTEKRKQKPIWHITGRVAVYPVFKSGYFSSYIRDGKSLTIYSYFNDKTDDAAAESATEDDELSVTVPVQL